MPPLIMSTESASQSSFRKKLNTTVTIGILTLAIITSLTSAWITSANIYDQMVEDGLQVTNSVAEQSVLSLLYGSGDNAEDALKAALGFPSIIHVSLLTGDGALLLSKGHHKAVLPKLIPAGHEAVLAQENSDEWIFIAPVYSEGAIESPDNAIALAQQEKESRELLGTVVVVKSKARLEETVAATITNNLTVSVVVAIILLAIIGRSFSYLTQPLSELSRVMGRAEEGDTNAFATPQGPQEVRDIGRAFNKMMAALAERDAQLRRHNELLEYEVAQRTHDLVYARDMAIQANHNKSEFLSRISHELRTPLQSILGYSDLLLEELPVMMADVRHDIETIVANANHLLAIINSVLDMSKLESGHMQLQLSAIVLKELIDGVVETATPLLHANHNRLTTKLQLETGALTIDEAKLRQILLNLLGNAIKFTQGGVIQLDVTQTSERLHIMVKDSGIGIQDDQIEHIFDPFYQIESSATRRFQGTGLGLAITHQFCKLLGGTIRVTSRYSEGSTFEILIPLPIPTQGTRDHADS